MPSFVQNTSDWCRFSLSWALLSLNFLIGPKGKFSMLIDSKFKTGDWLSVPPMTWRRLSLVIIDPWHLRAWKRFWDGNRNHATSSKRGSLEHFISLLFYVELRQLCSKALQEAPSFISNFIQDGRYVLQNPIFGGICFVTPSIMFSTIVHLISDVLFRDETKGPIRTFLEKVLEVKNRTNMSIDNIHLRDSSEVLPAIR